MFAIIVLAILGVITLLTVAAAVATRNNHERVSFGVPFGALVITLIVGLFMSMTTVDARAVGIQTSFGKYAGTLQPGLQLVAPWSSTEEFTTRLQTADLEGDQGVAVTFNGGGSGMVNATFRWSISDNAGEQGAKALWEKYRDFETVQSTLVDREGRDAVLNIANDYTPNDARTKQDEIAAKIKEQLVTKLAGYGIVVDSVSVLGMKLDDRTQASLDKIVAAQNDIERAKADKQRASIDNETAALRAKAGALTEGSLTRLCLDVVNNWDVSKNGQLPATFDCGLGKGSASILVGAK